MFSVEEDFVGHSKIPIPSEGQSSGGVRNPQSMSEDTAQALPQLGPDFFIHKSSNARKNNRRRRAKGKESSSTAQTETAADSEWRSRMAAFEPTAVTAYIDTILKTIQEERVRQGSDMSTDDEDCLTYKERVGSLIKDALPTLHNTYKLLSEPSLAAPKDFGPEMSECYEKLLSGAEESALPAGHIWARSKRVRDDSLKELKAHLSEGNDKWPTVAFQYQAFLGALSRLGNERDDFWPQLPNYDYMPSTDPHYSVYMSTVSKIASEEIASRRAANAQRTAKLLIGEPADRADEQEEQARAIAFQSFCSVHQALYFPKAQLPEDEKSIAYLQKFQELAASEAVKSNSTSKTNKA